ncbi:hypothetical protein ACQP25_11330 [Microtetraspora malaysiensis]
MDTAFGVTDGKVTQYEGGGRVRGEVRLDRDLFEGDIEGGARIVH